MLDFDNVDLDAPVEWHQFKAGDRVRVRLSGECRRGIIPGSRAAEAGVTHARESDGITGTIHCRNDTNAHAGQPEAVALAQQTHHDYCVYFDVPLHIEGVHGTCQGDDFAAAELEPLTDEERA